MAPFPETLVPVGRASSRWLVLLAPLLLWSSGCETLRPSKPVAALPPTGQPGEVMATWNPNVVFAPDPTNRGRSTPALTGRVHLIDKDTEAMIVGDGSMIVSLYDEHPQVGQDGDPVPLEVWKITPECLKLSARRDQVGWGYSLALPWSTYRPDIGSVRLLVRYQPASEGKGGMPIYRDCPLMTLQNSGGNAQATAQMNASRPLAPVAGTARCQINFLTSSHQKGPGAPGAFFCLLVSVKFCALPADKRL